MQGRVLGEDGGGVAGSTIRVLNSNWSTVTDEDGNFLLSSVSKGSHIIRVSALGYATRNHPLIVDKDTVIELSLFLVSNQLDEVLVTAQKSEEALYGIPLSVSIIDAKQVENQYVWNIMDITAMSPNVNIANPGDNRNVTSIRGITTTSYNQAVATYIDGVNQFGLDTYIPYLMDVERIEVIRGPQGTLYGRNAMAGVINIITKQPSNSSNGLLEMNLGNYGQQRYLMGIRMPVLKDKLFLGVSGMYNGLNGFYVNDVDDTHYDKQHLVFGNYYLKYLVNPQWAMTLNMKHISNRNQGPFALIAGIDDAFSTPFHLAQNAKTKMVDELRNLSLSVNYFGNTISFSSQTAFQYNYRYYRDPIDGDFSSLDAISIVNNYGSTWNNVRVFTQELKISSVPSDTSKTVSWTAGTFLFHQFSPTKQGTYFGADAGMTGEGIPIYSTSILTNAALNKGAAVFGQLAYRIGEKWEFRGGLRYDYEFAKLDARGEFQSDGQDILITQPDTINTANFGAFAPSFSVKYAFDQLHQLYGSYARGFRVGGISQLSSDPSEGSLRPFNPEYSNNFEIGTKNMMWDRRLLLNLAMFYTRVNDAQVPTLILPDAITVTQNTGRIESSGIELEAIARLTSHLSVSGSVGLIHARYLDLNTLGDGRNVQLKGNRPIFTPEWTGFLGVNYGVPLGVANNNQLEFGIYNKFVGQQYFVVQNNIGQKPYHLVSANIGWMIKGYEFVLWGQNLTDTRYIDYAYNFGFAAVHLGNPFTYGLTLRKRFGY